MLSRLRLQFSCLEFDVAGRVHDSAFNLWKVEEV